MKELTNQIYEASVTGQVNKDRPLRTYHYQIEDILKNGQVKSTANRGACTEALMCVEEAKDVWQDRSNWKTVPCVTGKGCEVYVIILFIREFATRVASDVYFVSLGGIYITALSLKWSNCLVLHYVV